MDDLINEFITETVENLALLDSALVKLEQNPTDEEILSNIFRIVHTIKGTCGFLGLPRLQMVAHASENVLGKIRDKELDASPQAISLVLTSLDSIKVLVDHLSQHGAEPEGEDALLIADLNRFADSKGAQSLESAEAIQTSDETPQISGAGREDFSHFFAGDDDLAALLAAQPTPPAEPKVVAPTPAPVTKAAPTGTIVVAQKPTQKPVEASDGGNQSIRVNLDVLENLMQMVSELVLNRNQLMQISRTKEDKDFMTPLQQLSHITSELQEGVMKTRMQPIGNAWSKFPRLVRDLSLEVGKKIELRMLGAETELDRQLLELIKDPLTHMVRNSCDHGLEMPADRLAAGKAETGTVTISAYHEGGHIIIDIADDGRGLNIARIKEKALSNGLATTAELDTMSEQQIMRFIFAAGFSTAEKVTSVSGRGVGMDVVRTNIEKIGGKIELSSEVGKGSKFSIKIPLTLAIVSVLIVEACGEKFAIPQLNVVELIRVAPRTEYSIESLNGVLVVRVREKLLPLVYLGELLKIQNEPMDWEHKEFFVTVSRVGNDDFGIIVDRIYDTEEIVVKPVADILKSLPLYSGNTILGDGTVIMILDPNGLARAVGAINHGEQNANAARIANTRAENMTSFLLVSTAKGGPKAVPLELVSRLEEIEFSSIETAGTDPVVQYRGDLMRLVMLDSTTPLPNHGLIPVVVFNYDRHTIGLVVQSIVDITEAVLDVKLVSHEKGYLGSMVIHEKSTDIVDVAYIFSQVIGEVEMPEAVVQKASEYLVLLVEDSPFFRNLTQSFLGAAGYRVIAADNGAEALERLQEYVGKIQLIVTDIEMPVMNGFEFAHQCRINPQLAHLPIIAYTSSLSEEVMQKAKSMGMHDCILKTDRGGLLEAMANCLTTGKALEVV